MEMKMSNITLSGGNTSALLKDNCDINDDFKYTLYSTVFCLVFIIGLVFNVVAIYIFACTLKIRNETTTYMINLAMSDLMFVLSLPFRIYYFIKRQWHFSDVLCKLSIALFYTNMYGSILFLTCISVDRFLAIVYPLRSRTLRTKRNARIACCCIWLVVLSGSLPTGFMLDTTSEKNQEGNNTQYCFENYSNEQWQTELSKVVLFVETVGFFIPFIINLTCSIKVLRTLQDPKTLARGGQLNKKTILRMITVHLLTFCFCFIPYNFQLIFYTLVRSRVFTNCTARIVAKTINPISLCIAVTNCCLDPVVYYFTSETIQNSIRRKAQSMRIDNLRDTLQNSPKLKSIRNFANKFSADESTI
ncbi:lysophosphatidic acid receptor 6 [Engraulis encrasicolus]|uniref:lysophosphatidic acid receptor 6 n=1 Tax=Engraulis encrasicolus TaxID=184585 RepID=UPI002FD5135A